MGIFCFHSCSSMPRIDNAKEKIYQEAGYEQTGKSGQRELSLQHCLEEEHVGSGRLPRWGVGGMFPIAVALSLNPAEPGYSLGLSISFVFFLRSSITILIFL